MSDDVNGQRPPPRRIPRFVLALMVIILVGSAATLLVGWWWQTQANDRRRELCDRTVDQQEHDRAMWVWLADYLGSPDNDEAVADLLRELDERLPVLVCVGNDQVPKVALP